MERPQYKLILLFLLMVTLPLKGNYRSEIYNAYIENKMDLWKNVIDRVDGINIKSDSLLLELINYQYGYIGYCLGFNKKAEARKYLELAWKNIEILENKNFKPAVIYSYKSAFYGFRISLNPLSAPVNGLKSLDCAKTALRLDPQNYLGYVQYGNAQFYMPAAFGGSKKEALSYFLQAKKILEKDPMSISGDWNYLSLMVVIGQAYTYLDDYSSAKGVYEEVLKKEPGFLYVKDDLYPKLLDKINK